MCITCVPDATSQKVLDSLGVTDGCEVSRGCWGLKPGSLEEQLVLFMAEPTTYSTCFLFKLFLFFSPSFPSFLCAISNWP